MVNIATKSPAKIRTASPKQSLKLGDKNSGSGIKKAISTTKPTDETQETKTNEELEKDTLEESVDGSTREETALEKKKNLDKLLKQGRPGKKDPTKKDSEKTDKGTGKEVDEEWKDNTKAKEKDSKRTDILTDEDRLKDVLKNDKDSIAKRYPGLERAKPGSSGSPKEGSAPQNNSNSNGSNNNGSSLNSGDGNGSGNGVSKLSDGGAGSSNHSHGNSNNFNGNSNSGNSFNRPNQGNGQGGGAIDFPRNNNGGGIQGPDHGGHGHDDSPKAHTKFEALFTEGHLEGKVIQASSSSEAQRIATSLKDIGAFRDIEQNGNSIRLSGFNADKSHDIHEAHGKALGREFLAGNIDKFSFEGVSEDIAGNLTQMLETKANEIGSENHNIASSCSDGTCNVTIENNQNNSQEQNTPEPQQNQVQEESNQEQNV